MAAPDQEEVGLVSEVSESQARSPAALLLIIGEAHSVEQKDLISQRIVNELSSWDAETAGCELDKELDAFVRSQPKPVTDKNGDIVLEYSSELLKVDVLVSPTFAKVQEKVRSFLLTGSRYRFLLHSGLALQTTGCWFLQDACFAFSSLAEIFHRPDVAVALAGPANAAAVLDVSVVGADVGEWSSASLAKLAPHSKLRLNRPPKDANADAVVNFARFLSTFVAVPSCDEILASTKVVGSFSFNAPTLYVFPGGQGDSALFGINGFNMLVDGGYGRRSCFWGMVRHLSTVDAVVVTHVGPDNVFGMSSFLEKKALEKGFPEIGVVYYNGGGGGGGDVKHPHADENTSVPKGLLVNLADEGAKMSDSLHQIGLSAQHCLCSPSHSPSHPINLYHKIGHGTLDMYVLNPVGDGKDLKELQANWTKMVNSPVKADQFSVCVLLVWKPYATGAKPTRILFPGSAPQGKIFEGLDRVKNIPLFQHALGVVEKVCEKPGANKGQGQVAKGKPPPAKAAESGKEAKKLTGGEQHRDASARAGEQKDAKKAGEQHKDVAKAGEQHKDAAKAGEPKDAKKAGGAEPREGKKPTIDTKSSKTSTTAPKKDSPTKVGPTKNGKSGKKTEGDGGKKGAGASGKEPAAVPYDGTKDSADVGKGDCASEFPSASDAADPLPGETGAATEFSLSQVQALPEPPELAAVERVPSEAEETGERKDADAGGLPEEEDGCGVADDEMVEKDDGEAEEDGCGVKDEEMMGGDDGDADEDGCGVRDEAVKTDASEAEAPKEDDEEEAFDPQKDWGSPAGLPAPMNGKEPGGAGTTRKTSAASVGHNASMVAGGAGASSSSAATAASSAGAAKKGAVGGAGGGDRKNSAADPLTKATAGRRPPTAPERLNNTTRDESEKDGASGKGRPAAIARPDPRKAAAASKPVVPFYVDVSYVPSHGDVRHFDVDFFRRVRARYYVVSGVSPDPRAFALLAEGKQAWDDGNATDATIIPTHESTALNAWLAGNVDQLGKQRITVTPPASKCTLQLQEEDAACAMYRLEF